MSNRSTGMARLTFRLAGAGTGLIGLVYLIAPVENASARQAEA